MPAFGLHFSTTNTASKPLLISLPKRNHNNHQPSINQQNMKRTPKPPLKPNPYWLMAEASHNRNDNQKKVNRIRREQYFEVLRFVKAKLMPKHPTEAFERDYTQEPNDNPRNVHAFMTKTFQWELICDEVHSYSILYAYNNCPFEAELKPFIDSFGKCDDVRISPQRDILTLHFKRYLRLEESKYFTQAW